MTFFPRRSAGFTLIEICMVLVLLGILAAVAVPKFFDLQDESRQRAAVAAIAEAQARINATFGQKVLQGSSCAEAVTYINDNFASLGDSPNKFGDFELELTGALSPTGGATPVKVTMNGETVGEGPLGTLTVAKCSVTGVGYGTPPSTLADFYALGNTQNKILASYQQANSAVNDKAGDAAALMQDVIANLGEPFVDNPVKYWRVVNSVANQQANIFLTSTNLENMSVSAMRVPYMQMQQTAGGDIRYFVGMMGVSKLNNGNGAMLINDRNTYAGTVWNQTYGGVSAGYGGIKNSGSYLVKDSNGNWTEQSTQPQGMSYEEAAAAYKELLKLYPTGAQIVKE